MPPLLLQLVAPLLQLRRDGLNTGGLLNGSRFNTSCVLVTEFRIRELSDGMYAVLIEAFPELLEHFNGSADLGGAWRLHDQICMPREDLCAG